MTAPGPLRSLLFVPGSRPELIPKAAASPADALVLDLEDSVPPPARDEARANVAAALARAAHRLTFVRINHPNAGCLEQDLGVLAPHPGQAIMLPKIAGPADLTKLDRRLVAFERGAGLAPQTIGLMIVIESSLGLRNLFDLLHSSPRIRGAGFASAEDGDFMADIGGQWTPTGEALAYARGKFVCDARAAGALWLFDGAFMNLRDDDALAAETRLARICGFTGKIAIHPRQVATINRIFSPTETEIGRARRLIAAFRAAEAKGQAATQFEGMMIDYANVRRAEQVLAAAGAPEAGGST